MRPEDRIGQILASKYRVEGLLGEGGMGVVLRARHVELGEQVAVKLLALELVGREELVARFQREARAAARIKSDHVARVMDVGQTDDRVPFLVMELLDGEDLESYLRNAGGVLDPYEAARFVFEACDAIAEAHELGIVHRDLKPANLFLAKRGRGRPKVKVLDFGISKVEGDGASATKTSAIMGSPAYMSPEQLRSTRDVDGRTDVWSLGTVLFELCTGRLPFDGESVADLTANILRSEAPRLADVAPEVPAELARVVDACLEKDVARRLASANELARLLEPFAMQAASGPSRSSLHGAPSSRLFDGKISSSTAVGQTMLAGGQPASATVGTDATVVVDSQPGSSAPSRSRSKWAFGLTAAALVTAVSGLAWVRLGPTEQAGASRSLAVDLVVEPTNEPPSTGAPRVSSPVAVPDVPGVEPAAELAPGPGESASPAALSSAPTMPIASAKTPPRASDVARLAPGATSSAQASTSAAPSAASATPVEPAKAVVMPDYGGRK